MRSLVVFSLMWVGCAGDTSHSDDPDVDTEREAEEACPSKLQYASCEAAGERVAAREANNREFERRWDERGNLVWFKEVAPNGWTRITDYTWDAQDRMTSWKQTVDGNAGEEATYSYGTQGELLGVEYKSGASVSYTHDADGRQTGSSHDRDGDDVADLTCVREWGTEEDWTWIETCDDGVSYKVQENEHGQTVRQERWFEEEMQDWYTRTFDDRCLLQKVEHSSTAVEIREYDEGWRATRSKVSYPDGRVVRDDTWTFTCP